MLVNLKIIIIASYRVNDTGDGSHGPYERHHGSHRSSENFRKGVKTYEWLGSISFYIYIYIYECIYLYLDNTYMYICRYTTDMKIMFLATNVKTYETKKDVTLAEASYSYHLPQGISWSDPHFVSGTTNAMPRLVLLIWDTSCGQETQVAVCALFSAKTVGKVTHWGRWMNIPPNFKLCKLLVCKLGKLTRSRLWLKSQPNIKL